MVLTYNGINYVKREPVDKFVNEMATYFSIPSGCFGLVILERAPG
jgi:hypothetical protein